MADNWHRAAALADLRDGELFGTKIGDVAIGLTRIDGEIYAIDDICSHEYALLSQGFLEGCEIECPLHQARFDVRSGKCLLEPAERDLCTFAVKVEGGEVFVQIPAVGK
jgi:nitrite reductase/ring-hydroxylating ferredoxin subunit